MSLQQTMSALAVTALTVVGTLVLVQRSVESDDTVVLPTQPQPPVAKSDAHRLVGKVLQIDRERGLVNLATDEGVVVVAAPPQTLQVIRVGETVSVPRDISPSASPAK